MNAKANIKLGVLLEGGGGCPCVKKEEIPYSSNLEHKLSVKILIFSSVYYLYIQPRHKAIFSWLARNRKDQISKQSN